MDAIVLTGGFGTRLRHIVSDVPKPMAPVCGKPFLQYILDDLASKGIRRVILAVGYRQKCITSFFGARYAGMEIVYSQEDTPLLTGGAIKAAMKHCAGESVLIVNGDTFFDVDIATMKQAHETTGATLTVATKEMMHFVRYGTVETDATGCITAFHEKRSCEKGAINGGIYIAQKSAVTAISSDVFSFESDYMEKQVGKGRFYAFPSDGYFIDIGVPEDYERAQHEFA